MSDLLERLVDIADDIIRVLAADAQPDELGRDVGHPSGLLALLEMGRDRRDGGNALDPSEVRCPVDEPEAVEDLSGIGRRTVDPEAHEVAVTVDLVAGAVAGVHELHVFFSDGMETIARESQIVYLIDLRMSLEELGDLLAVSADQVHLRAECAKVVQREKGVEGRG